jgi:hypothetical protein
MKFGARMRATAVGALTLALLASGASAAFAAPGDPINPQSNGSKGGFFLYDANTGEYADGNTSRVYARDEVLIASGSATDVNAEINPSATRPVTGATPFSQVWRFISDKDPAKVAGGTNTWKAFAGDSAAGAHGGTYLPDMTLDAFGPAVDVVIAAGGSYWYGIAYTTNAGVTTIGAVYREINITAGTGAYTVGAVEVEAAAATDVATTTTLAADKASVELGGSVTLTATVAASGKTPSGNVEFYKGATKLATRALSAGAASYAVTPGTTGTQTYSAKFVENTVDTDKFLASTSSDLSIDVTEADAPLPPNAPTESALNVNTANGATASYDEATHKATLNVDAVNNGAVVNLFAYSTPTFLGQVTVTDGKVSGDVSVLATGTHKLAITDPDNGDVIAWASFDKTDAATKPSISKTINAEAATVAPSDGEFSLTNLSGDTVNLTNPAIVDGKSVVSGTLGSFKVTDLRQVSKPGWKLQTTVTDFTKGTDTIAASALGIDPKSVGQAGTGATAPTLGDEQISGSASYPWDFATLAAGSYSGASTYDADLTFTAPAGKPAGTYTSTLTLTLISQ